jgi:hypothetical protein
MDCGKGLEMSRGFKKENHFSHIFSFLLFLPSSLGTASFIYLYIRTASFSILDHSFHPSALYLVIGTGIILFSLYFLWIFLARWERRTFGGDYNHLLREGLITFFPLSLALLSPFMLRFYLTASDFKLRLNIMASIIILAIISLKLAQLNRRKILKPVFDRAIKKFESLSTKKKLLLLFLVSYVLYNLCTFCIISQGFAYTGDEPYYLLTTHSLYQDQDINVANNYAQNDYFRFYPRKYFPDLRLRAYARFGRKGTDYVYPINQPGVSFLILPFYWLSRFFEGRTLIFILKGSLSIWAAFLGLQLFLFSRERWGKESVSLTLWFAYSFTAPILFYAVHLYPEVPIALFSLYIYRKVRSKTPLSLFHYYFLGFLLSLFFWFGLKYNMIFWPLLLISCYFLFKNHKPGWRIAVFLFLPFLSLGLNYYYIYELYGSFNPIAIYEGVITADTLQNYKDILLKTPILLRIDSFFDYFLDQRDGLLLYSPLYFFAFLGLIEIYRRSKRDFFALMFIAVPFILNYAFFAHRQGGSPQGRILTPLSWTGVILIGYFFVHNRKKIYSGLFWISYMISLIIPILLLQNPSFLYQPTTHEYTFRGSELFVSLSNLYFYLPGILPSFIKVNNLGYLPNYIWLGLILLFIMGYAYRKNLNLLKHLPIPTILVMAGLMVFFLWFSLFPRTALISPVEATYSPSKNIGFYTLDRFSRMRNPGEFHLSKSSYEYTFRFTSWREIEKLKLKFGALNAVYKVKIKLFDLTIFEGNTSDEIKTSVITTPPRYRYKNTNLYILSVGLEYSSGTLVTENPYFLSIYPERLENESY